MGALLLIAVAAYGPVLSVTLQFYEKVFYYTSSVGVYGYIKGLREMASPVILAYTFVGKYAEENYGGILGIVLLVTIAFGVLGYYAFVNRKPKEPVWPLFFHGLAQS